MGNTTRIMALLVLFAGMAGAFECSEIDFALYMTPPATNTLDIMVSSEQMQTRAVEEKDGKNRRSGEHAHNSTISPPVRRLAFRLGCAISDDGR